MQLDNRILLMGRGIDAVEAFDRGTAAGQNALAARQNVDLTNLYRAQGANILAGDPGALNALAGISPEAAFTMQTNRQQVQANNFNMEQAKVQAARETEAHLANLDAGKAAQEAAELRSMAEAATLANSPEQWQQVFAGTPYEGAWDNRAAVLEILGTQKSVVDRLFPAAPNPKDSFMSVPGVGLVDLSDPNAPKTVFEAKPDSTNISLGGGSDKQVFDSMEKSAEAAQSAATGLAALSEASKAIAGGAITGIGADQRLAAAKLGALLGITDPKVVENTETFRSTIAPQVAALMKATVGSTQISNADREFAEKAAGGSITLDQATIIRLLDIMERAANVAIDRHQAKLDAVYPDNGDYARERALFGITAPTSSPVAGSGSQDNRTEADILGEYGLAP